MKVSPHQSQSGLYWTKGRQTVLTGNAYLCSLIGLCEAAWFQTSLYSDLHLFTAHLQGNFMIIQVFESLLWTE